MENNKNKIIEYHPENKLFRSGMIWRYNKNYTYDFKDIKKVQTYNYVLDLVFKYPDLHRRNNIEFIAYPTKYDEQQVLSMLNSPDDEVFNYVITLLKNE